MVLRFVVDVNVGRLAKWLRVMGYDSLFIPDVDDAELLRIAEEQGRIALTKDRYILQRRAVATGRVRAVLVRSDDFREQPQCSGQRWFFRNPVRPVKRVRNVDNCSGD